MHRLAWIVLMYGGVIAANASTPMTCLHPEKVRAMNLSDWQAFDDESERKLTAVQLKPFAEQAHRFVLAAWTTKDGHRYVSCFYQNKHNQQLGFYLQKKDVTPIRAHQRWYEAGLQAKDLHCSASAENCRFV